MTLVSSGSEGNKSCSSEGSKPSLYERGVDRTMSFRIVTPVITINEPLRGRSNYRKTLYELKTVSCFIKYQINYYWRNSCTVSFPEAGTRIQVDWWSTYNVHGRGELPQLIVYRLWCAIERLQAYYYNPLIVT